MFYQLRFKGVFINVKVLQLSARYNALLSSKKGSNEKVMTTLSEKSYLFQKLQEMNAEHFLHKHTECEKKRVTWYV